MGRDEATIAEVDRLKRLQPINRLKTRNNPPARIIDAGRVKIQARAMLRIVRIWTPEPRAAIVPATPEETTWGRAHRKAADVGEADGEHGDGPRPPRPGRSRGGSCQSSRRRWSRSASSRPSSPGRATGRPSGGPRSGRSRSRRGATCGRRRPACARNPSAEPADESSSISSRPRSIFRRSARTSQRSRRDRSRGRSASSRVSRKSASSWSKRDRGASAFLSGFGSRRDRISVTDCDAAMVARGTRGVVLGVEGVMRGQDADQDQHDQADPLLAVVGAVGHAHSGARADQGEAGPSRRRLVPLRGAIDVGRAELLDQ